MRTYLIACALSASAGLVLTWLVRNLAVRHKLYDEPEGGRKLHRRPIPRLGGVAVVLAFSLPLLALSFYSNRITHTIFQERGMLMALLTGGAILFFIGLIDDLKGMPALIKLGGQIAAAAVVWYFGIRIEVLSIPFLHKLQLEWLSVPATIFWVVLCINAINLIDGLDGLAGGVVVLAGGTLFVMSVGGDAGMSALLMSCMVGAVMGFLVFNLKPASIFLGDTGSMSLGFLLAISSIHSSQKSYTLFSLVAAFIALGFPIFDLAMAFTRRLLAGQPVFRADQDHVHHILLRKGLSAGQSVTVLFTASAALGLLALVFVYSSDAISAVAILGAAIAMAITVRVLGYGDIIQAGRRTSALTQLQQAADVRATTVDELRQALIAASSLEELWSLLESQAGQLGLELLELQLSPSLCEEGRAQVFSWERPSISKNPDTNFATLEYTRMPLRQAQVRDLGVLRTAWYSENALLRPLHLSLTRNIADTVALALAELHGEPVEPRDDQRK